MILTAFGKLPLLGQLVRKTVLQILVDFVPHQIVLGRNISLPLIYNDKPSADLPQNEIIIEHLSVLQVLTRQAFTATKSSKKLKTALQKKQQKNQTNQGKL